MTPGSAAARTEKQKVCGAVLTAGAGLRDGCVNGSGDPERNDNNCDMEKTPERIWQKRTRLPGYLYGAGWLIRMPRPIRVRLHITEII